MVSFRNWNDPSKWRLQGADAAQVLGSGCFNWFSASERRGP